VRLSSTANDAPAAIGVPSTVTIPAGQLSAIVDVALPQDATTATYAITATGGGANYTQRLDVIWAPAGTLRIAAVLPNPVGDELQDEAVHIRNISANAVQLGNWSITRRSQPVRWELDAADGTVESGQTAVVTRRGRPMALLNPGGDVILVNPEGFVKDTKTYGPAAPGQLITFA
jgi:Lamin Tail Domain